MECIVFMVHSSRASSFLKELLLMGAPARMIIDLSDDLVLLHRGNLVELRLGRLIKSVFHKECLRTYYVSWH